jgi:hypothetical protein
MRAGEQYTARHARTHHRGRHDSDNGERSGAVGNDDSAADEHVALGHPGDAAHEERLDGDGGHDLSVALRQHSSHFDLRRADTLEARGDALG